MTTLSKEQFAKLSIEQQEALGEMEARRVKRRQELWETARGYRYRMWHVVTATCLAAGAVVVLVLAGESQSRLVPVLPFVFACAIVGHQVAVMRKRLDALVELFKDDPA